MIAQSAARVATAVETKKSLSASPAASDRVHTLAPAGIRGGALVTHTGSALASGIVAQFTAAAASKVRVDMRPQLATRSGNKIGGQRKTAGLRADRCHLPGLPCRSSPGGCVRVAGEKETASRGAQRRREPGARSARHLTSRPRFSQRRTYGWAPVLTDGIRALPYRAAAIESRDGDATGKCALSAAPRRQPGKRNGSLAHLGCCGASAGAICDRCRVSKHVYCGDFLRNLGGAPAARRVTRHGCNGRLLRAPRKRRCTHYSALHAQTFDVLTQHADWSR